jgi:hypothetical protein
MKDESSEVNDLKSLMSLIQIGGDMLVKSQTGALNRVLRYFAVSIANSSVAVAELCERGFGADAVKISRGMFETYVSFCYLLRRPSEVEDFVGFDAIARHKRLQTYKSKFPELYSSFPVEKILAVNEAYRAVKKKFTSPKGNVRERWCRHSLAEMASVAGLAEMYELLYRHASFIHHPNPMGLAMLIDSTTLDIQPGPTRKHTGIALRMATLVLYGTLLEYSKLIDANHKEAFKQIEGALNSTIECEGSPLGSLAEAF